MTQREPAAEVLEIGKTLFDVLIENVAAREPTENQVVVDVREAQAAADGFFVALRLLLGLDQEGA